MASLGYTNRTLDAAVGDVDDAFDLPGDLIAAGMGMVDREVEAQGVLKAVEDARGQVEIERKRLLSLDPLERAMLEAKVRRTT